MPKVTAIVSVPLTVEFEVDYGDKVSEMIEKFITNRISHECDIDGEIDIHSVECDEIEDLGEDDTINQCDHCSAWTASENICDACREKEKQWELKEKIKEETQRFLQEAKSASSTVSNPVLDDYLQAFSVVADAKSTVSSIQENNT